MLFEEFIFAVQIYSIFYSSWATLPVLTIFYSLSCVLYQNIFFNFQIASYCKGTSVRGNKVAEMSLGTNGIPGDIKEQMAEITLGM
jgi:hypothetical protein